MHLHALENDQEYINLQVEMVRMQNWIIENNKKLIIVFEGRDSAGKGGAIMRFIRYINPRFYRVIALNKPSDVERGQWYFKRYLAHLPDPGEIVFFDRSWYNRAVVEPVMGFCTKEQYRKFMEQVITIENILIDDDYYLIKLWFSIDKDEQKKRLDERKENPLISWKLSTVDIQAQMKWGDYTRYKQAMFDKTGTKKSPWVVIKGNNKDIARKEAMRYVLNTIPYEHKGMTDERLKPDPGIFTVIAN
ncbi:MAG: polyphosphate kinase 2 [Flavobacteriaceae bacterium]|nr:polyphosphate kinase 2 [Bacteroidia bacterium]MBT8287804.1 polyphosphate kinase 2 [Bacteroidia bacterium]NNF75441.1 polyphosphate kinase 2 [Flavobacteriaceae bacterium]NNK72002.1 polyphosphate kinase 2 [Flavobacteriaceae bacterium]